MPQIRKSIAINAPVSEVFAFAAAPENLPVIWPSLIEVSNVKENPEGGHAFDWIYKLAGIKLRGHSETIEFEPDRLIVVQNETGIKSTFRYSFQGQDDTTVFTQEVEYEIPDSLLARFAAPFIHKLNEREAEIVMDNLKARLEEGEAAVQPEARPEL